MEIINAEFEVSAGRLDQIKKTDILEIAMVGKSNVGKSSFINFISSRNSLAKTSKEPGKTKLINYFNINNNQFYFVDLPGYGYARVSQVEKEKWGKLIQSYFFISTSIANVFLLVDLRRDPSEDDIMIAEFLYSNNIPMTVVGTKLDKVKSSEVDARKQKLAQGLSVGKDDVILVSSNKKLGRQKVLDRIEQILRK